MKINSKWTVINMNFFYKNTYYYYNTGKNIKMLKSLQISWKISCESLLGYNEIMYYINKWERNKHQESFGPVGARVRNGVDQSTPEVSRSNLTHDKFYKLFFFFIFFFCKNTLT